jgi:acetyl-CoA carboxylase biotin carboxylase subunit
MLAKLITWAPSRLEAIERMRRALLELTIEGVESSRDFHLRVMDDDDFRRGDIEIQWLERRLDSLVSIESPADGARVAAIAGALLAERDRQRRAGGGADATKAARPDAAAAATAESANGDAWRRAARLEGLRSS